MQVHYSTNDLPHFKNAVVTIGTFDGVHLGHQQIIKQLKQEASAINGETIIITFHPHPRSVIASTKPTYLLTTLNEKIILLNSFDIDHLIVVSFDEAFSNQTPEEYVQHFLFEKCHPHTLIIGYDHRFGKNRKGDYHLLENLGKQLGFVVKEIPEQVINEVTISSTRIREALLNTDVDTANNYLGHKYFFEGIVVDGNKLGRTLGYPTANIVIRDENKLIPSNGIYVAETEVESEKYQGMLSIGLRPTVDGKNRTIELNIFNFSNDIYGHTIKVFLCTYLRPELKFNSLDELVKKIDEDKINSLNYFQSK